MTPNLLQPTYITSCNADRDLVKPLVTSIGKLGIPVNHHLFTPSLAHLIQREHQQNLLVQRGPHLIVWSGCKHGETALAGILATIHEFSRVFVMPVHKATIPDELHHSHVATTALEEAVEVVRCDYLESLENNLSDLAAMWRGTNDSAREREIVARYAQTMDIMYHLGWDDILDMDSELADELMPARYRDLHPSYLHLSTRTTID